MKPKSRSYNQAQLKTLSDALCDNIDGLLDHFGVEYKRVTKMITMCCPIHDGDNASAFNLYPEGDTYRGNWKCRSQKCEEIFKSSVLGLIRGILSKQEYGWSREGDTTCSFDETVKFAEKFLNQDLSTIKVDHKHIEKTNFVNTIRHLATEKPPTTQRISRLSARQALNIPSPYFLNRGFSKEILEKYDVGDCQSPSKEMSNRAVVPVYTEDHKYLSGCTGRSIFEKCDTCKTHHEASTSCPETSASWKHSKWKHNFSFKSQEHLYNYWFAKTFIKQHRYAIIVESPGNVWRLEESGIHNSVALFGSSLADKQKLLLDISGAMSLVLMMDNDQAGQIAAGLIKNKCLKTYNVFNIELNHADIASMSIDQIHLEIKPILEKLDI